MLTRSCSMCGRALRRPAPDGYGPVCRRKLHPPTPTPTAPAAAPPLDHAGLAAAGQLAIPLPEPLPYPTRPHLPPVIRGRHVTDLNTHGRT